jgi:hypothetical protein
MLVWPELPKLRPAQPTFAGLVDAELELATTVTPRPLADAPAFAVPLPDELVNAVATGVPLLEDEEDEELEALAEVLWAKAAIEVAARPKKRTVAARVD